MSLVFSDVTLTLGGRRVLDRVDFALAPGEFVGVLGANGAGKTTMMRAALGLLPIDAGRITVDGQTPAIARRAIGYMPQTRTEITARLSGWQMVASAMSGDRWGLPWLGAADRRRVDEAIDLVDATALAARPIGALSGGERQRLLLAVALLGKPALLMLDEPLMGLDPHHQDEMVSRVSELQRRLGITVLFSAHEINPLLPALDRILYLGQGRAALGTVDEVIVPETLSRLYGAPIEVVRAQGRIFVMSGAHDVGHDACTHGSVAARPGVAA